MTTEHQGVAEFSRDEKEILRLARDMSNLVGTSAWRELVKVFDQLISVREVLCTQPIGQQHPSFQGMDYETRIASIETVKGAIIGLRLAKDLPQTIIEHAASIRAVTSPDQDDIDE